MASITDNYLDAMLLVSVIIVLIVVLINHNIQFSSSPRSARMPNKNKVIDQYRCRVNAIDKASFTTPIRMGAVRERDVPVSMTVSGRYIDNEFGKMY